MGITYEDYLIDIGQNDITPEQEREAARAALLAIGPGEERRVRQFHPDVLACHAEFGGDLEDMQRRYDDPSPEWDKP